MTDTTLPPRREAADRIEPVDIEQEMQRSYIDYAMSVIVGRALPEVRDGLKPVHRGALRDVRLRFRPDRGHAKSARSVAETMGNYHPHGDASIYDTLVRMAQPSSLRYPLCRRPETSARRYDRRRHEYTERGPPRSRWRCCVRRRGDSRTSFPTTTAACESRRCSPSRVPQPARQRVGGIAVGMATNIPPQQPARVGRGRLLVLDNHEADEEANLAAVCETGQGRILPPTV